MSDEDFCRHMNLRHGKDIGSETLLEWEPSGSNYAGTLAALPAYRAFHARCHSLAVPGQYDHNHALPDPE